MDLNSDSTGIFPTSCDVLLGRGRSNSDHLGNKHYQASIQKYYRAYFSMRSQREKNILSSNIVREIQQKYSGRFLKKGKEGWKVIPDETARIKVAHSLQYYERIRRKDQPNQPLPIPWNSKGASQASRLQSKGPDALVATQAAFSPSLQRVGNNPVFMNQQAQTDPYARNRQGQHLELEYDFLGQPLLAHASPPGSYNASHFSQTTIFCSAGTPEPENMHEGTTKSKLSPQGTNNASEVFSLFSSTNGINQTSQNNSTAFTTQPTSAENDMQSKVSPKTIRQFFDIQSEAKANPSQVAPATDTAVKAINELSKTRNDRHFYGSERFDKNSQQMRSETKVNHLAETKKSKVIFESPRADGLEKSVVPGSTNSTSSSSSSKKIFPEICASSNYISTDEKTPGDYDGYNYKYENPLLTKKQEQPTTKTISEYLAAKQLVELAGHGGCISQSQPLLENLEVENLSYSSRQLLAMIERKRQSSSGATHESKIGINRG